MSYLRHTPIGAPSAARGHATVRSARSAFAGAVAALALVACGDARPGGEDSAIPASVLWIQPDTVGIGLGRPADIKAQSRDRVWVADVVALTIFAVSVPDSSYLSIGAGDREPVQVRLPAKLAVDERLGVAMYDGESRRVEHLTLDGDWIRGFDVEFQPAVMSFTQEPVGLTFGIAAGDSLDRRAMVLRADLDGGARDTLLSESHGPEALRGASAMRGQTAMSASRTGMWVYSRATPDSVFEVSARGTRRLALRAQDTTAVGILADVPGELVWMVHSDSTGVRYEAYDGRLATAATDSTAVGAAHLGTRTTPLNFRPYVIHDGVVIGLRGLPSGGPGLVAFDLHADRFARRNVASDAPTD